MKNILLIIYDKAIDSQILCDRIKSLGPNYQFWDNHWFVETQLDAKKVYKQISTGEYEQASIIVMELSRSQINYYGRMNTSLWDWLKSR